MASRQTFAQTKACKAFHEPLSRKSLPTALSRHETSYPCWSALQVDPSHHVPNQGIQIKPLTIAGQASMPSFDHARGDPVEDDVVVLPTHSVVLIEGLYTLLGRDAHDALD